MTENVSKDLKIAKFLVYLRIVNIIAILTKSSDYCRINVFIRWHISADSIVL
jgi:hypothetical protein